MVKSVVLGEDKYTGNSVDPQKSALQQAKTHTYSYTQVEESTDISL